MPTIRTLGQRVKVSWLDLRGTGLSVIERLCLEEALLRHDPLERCWAIVGNHEPFHNRILSLPDSIVNGRHHSDRNTNCIIVLGIGGKPHELLDLDLVRKDGVICAKRFSGGGTVVVDHSSILTTFIMRTHCLRDVSPYPRDIMQWSSDAIFNQVFGAMKNEMMNVTAAEYGQRSLVMESKSCGVELTGKMLTVPRKKVTDIPDFSLRENDYVLGHRKMGGNAQSIIKDGWLHHTSFLWDYFDDHMKYLTLPSKRPEYRGERSHDDFLVKLKQYFQYHPLGKKVVHEKVKEAMFDVFHVEEVTLREALELVDSELNGMQSWFDSKCRTRVIEF
eukprot:CAMPEP_0172514696 /NCGR_PEP_ID=MMETSP1066-20121228/262083_1 /TAXON_ID=671091 /ORGANISM="Coscinodiscus wailesii, Strain CCMP2513" /LENGTH=332 /DNA_ID=CAMNT_0013295469 /DNA_START=49 /DNA_END=1047 /DNA_ORIENTATION=-